MERLDNSKLSPLQKHIVDKIATDKSVAIVGGPGTGKTVLAMSGMGLNSGKKTNFAYIFQTAQFYDKRLQRNKQYRS